ncbi:MAG TPA: phosphoribosylglycinamide formyltransferase [Clostridia bacterium]|jgi:phosphoribosylglycinamide formyltransferase-1|nr:phosphoribosylglycinamide formyltransferase [Clostridia bacterium]HHY05657.1 phosphoribosylglycinamide formyltransferase [Clostridia bacterium]
MEKLRLAVLASGRGSNLQAIMNACQEGRINAEVVVVLSDQENALALERAKQKKIPALCVNPQEFLTREAYEKKLMEVIKGFTVDYLLLAGFMRILSPVFIRGVAIPILNIHPSLLPAFSGLNAQRQALEYGVRYSGCTVHFVDEGVDTGPIISQAVVPVYPDDTEESLAQRILQEEHQLYPQVIQLLSKGRICCEGRKVIIIEEEQISE